MAYNITQVDLPRAFLAASQVRGQQYQNQMARTGMERRQAMNRLAPLAAQGDEGAIGEMFGVDPGMAMKMDDRQREQALAGTRDILAAVLVSDTPEKWEAAIDRYAAEGIDVEKYRGRFADRPLIAGRLKAQLGEMGGGGKPQSPLGKLKTDLDAGLITPEQYDAAVTKANAPRGALVEITTPGQTIDERLLDMDLKTIAGTAEAVKAGADFMPRLEVIVQGLESGNVETGRFQEATLPLLQFAQSIGWYHDPKLGQKEAVLAAISYMIPRMRVVGSGQTSDVEIKLFSQATAQYSNTPEGNILIARGMMQIQRRNKQLLAAQRSWVRKHKTLEGFDADKELGPMFPKVVTQADLNKLDSGTVFIIKDGSEEDGMFVVKD